MSNVCQHTYSMCAIHGIKAFIYYNILITNHVFDQLIYDTNRGQRDVLHFLLEGNL